jgi:hypothetical protein
MGAPITKATTISREVEVGNGPSINASESPTVERKGDDEIEGLVKKNIANLDAAENAFKSASALVEKHKTKYPELEQYVENVSSSDRSIQMLDDVKDPRRAHYMFKIAVTGVTAAYQVTYPGEKDHSNVEQAAWISDFEEALAKAIAQIILTRRATGTASPITVKGELLPP